MNTAQTTKNLAQKIAQQMAQEPLEILKSAREQVTGEELPPSTPNPASQDNSANSNQGLVQDTLKSQRRVDALNRELDDIRKQRLFKDLQRRISQGEEIPLEEYPELSIEQKQVFKAQMEVIKMQMQNAKNANGGGLVEPAGKKGRQMFNFGKKTAMKREQTHVEKPVPPSG